MSDNRYYISSFAWTTVSKVLNALVGFISVPLLMEMYGKGNFGILSLATACNAYMHLLDLGINTGAVRYYSMWKKSGDESKLHNVSHSNLTFYLVIALVNALLLCGIALFGENWFEITPDEFQNLRACLFILAAFSVFSWSTTAFNQLLVADRQMAFTMKMQTIQVILKAVLIVVAITAGIPLRLYFLLLTAVMASLIIPYAIKSRRDGLIDSLRPEWHWIDFKPVLVFSLSIFALSIFQITATESRAIVLGIRAFDGSNDVADFKILSVVPSLIITIRTSFSAVFLPRSSEMFLKKNPEDIRKFSYKWTVYTTVIANVLCFPFMLCAAEVLTAYVGTDYAILAPWLVLWCVSALIQIHTTPTNSLVIASGKTRALVITTAAACVISIVLNFLLCRRYGAGSAVFGYFIYVVIVIGLYYVYYYKKLLSLSRWKMLRCFLAPTAIAALTLIPVSLIGFSPEMFGDMNLRLACILVCLLKTLVWIVPYFALLFAFRILGRNDIKEMTGR